MLTNCPNCGAPLTKDGWCDYYKTKVRLANLMEMDYDVKRTQLERAVVADGFEDNYELCIAVNDTPTIIPATKEGASE